MSRHVKRNPFGLAVGAIFLLVIHCVDMQFLILPTAGGHEHAAADHAAHAGGFLHGMGEYLHNRSWGDFGCFVGLLSMLGGIVLMNVRRTNLVPVRDPRLAESLHFHNL
jgi:UDP-N-acetylenolpyruvoylglucosamine reductase